MDGKTTEEAFETLFYACENIRDYKLCHECPLCNDCLEDPEHSVNDFTEVSAARWDEFFEVSEHAQPTEEDRRAEYADMMRKIDIEERMIDDEYL